MLEWLSRQQSYFLTLLASLLVLIVKFYLEQALDERKNKPVLPKNVVHLVQQRLTESLSKFS